MKPLKEVISINSEVCKAVPCIIEKSVLDFFNSIHVAHDHIRTQKDRNSFRSRIFDGLIGNSARRQSDINTNLQDAINKTVPLIEQLFKGVEINSYALNGVKDEIKKLKSGMVELSEDLYFKLDALSQELDMRMLSLQEEVSRIDVTQQANLNLNRAFSKWKAGRLSVYSPAGRCYAVTEELRWGAFGDYCRSHSARDRDRFIEQAIDMATIQLAEDAGVRIASRVSTYDNWFSLQNSSQHNDFHDGLTYLADEFDEMSSPFISTVTQSLPERLVRVPLLANASRVAEAVIQEVFMEVLND